MLDDKLSGDPKVRKSSTWEMLVSKLHNYQQQQQFRFLQSGATTTTTIETTTTITMKCHSSMVFMNHFLHSFFFKNLVFYQIHYSSVLRLTPFLGFIYDSLDFFEVDRIFGLPDMCVDLRIFGKVLADLFEFLARCTRIFGVIHPSESFLKLSDLENSEFITSFLKVP